MKITNEIRTGLLGILAIVLFIIGYKMLMGSGLFSSSKTVIAEYDNIQGLTKASFVQLNGLNVGKVYDVYLSKKNPGKVIVEMTVDNDIIIPRDSKAIITSLDLLGTKAINLELGQSGEELKKGDQIAGDVHLSMLEELGGGAKPLISKIDRAVASLDTVIRGIGNILNPSSQNNLKNAISDLQVAVANFKSLAGGLNEQKGRISNLMGNFEKVSSNLNSFSGNLENNNQTINNLLKNAENTTANLSRLELQKSLNGLNSTMDNLQTTLGKLNHGSGSMAMLMNDDELYRNLKNTLATLNNLIYDVSARPKRYLSFSVFGKKTKNDTPPGNAPNANK